MKFYGFGTPPEAFRNCMNNYDREAGRTSVQRNTFYEPIRVLESLQTATNANEAEPPSVKSKLLEDNLATA